MRWRAYPYACAELSVAGFELASLPHVAAAQDRSSQVAARLTSFEPLARPIDWIHHWYSPHDGDEITMQLGRVDNTVILRFPETADFLISDGARFVDIHAAGDVSSTTIEHLLLDQVLPRVLAELGYMVLHGGAVEVGGRAILFLGETGRGKSTLTAAMALRGHPLLGDDGIVVARGPRGITIQPTYPSLRLLPDSIASLCRDGTPLTPMAHYSDKQRVFVPLAREAAPELPLDRIYVLAPADEDRDAGVTLRRMSPREVCVALVANRFELDPTDVSQASRRLTEASELAEIIPVFSLAYPRRYDWLDEVCQAILKSGRMGGGDEPLR